PEPARSVRWRYEQGSPPAREAAGGGRKNGIRGAADRDDRRSVSRPTYAQQSADCRSADGQLERRRFRRHRRAVEVVSLDQRDVEIVARLALHRLEREGLAHL